MSRSSSPAEDAAPSRRRRGFESRTRRKSPRQVDRGQDYESRLRRSNRLGGTGLETCWSGNRPVCYTVADDSRARSIRAVSSSFVRSLRWTEIDRRRAATSSHAGASPARSSFVPLSERLGPGLPNRRAGFDSLAVLETACVARCCPTVWPGRHVRFYQGGEVGNADAC